jgi:hypothetical protein
MSKDFEPGNPPERPYRREPPSSREIAYRQSFPREAINRNGKPIPGEPDETPQMLTRLKKTGWTNDGGIKRLTGAPGTPWQGDGCSYEPPKGKGHGAKRSLYPPFDVRQG